MKRLLSAKAIIQHTGICMLLLAMASCKPEKSGSADSSVNIDTSEAYTEPAEIMELPDKSDWQYDMLYGTYEHESNGAGFFATAIVRPEGNDLWLDLSVKKSSCSGKITGTVGIALATEFEYAGFLNQDDCRLELYFNTEQKTIRVEEIGYCQLYEPGCSVAGVYRLRKTPQ